jgi:hypothetical protein
MDVRTFQIGDTITMSGTFYDTANALTDTVKPVFVFKNPAGLVTSATYGVDASVVRESLGKFYMTAYVPTGSASAAGTWHYWIGSVSGIKMASHGRWIIESSPIFTG